MMKVAYKREVYPLEKTESCILKMLAYFSVFEYPLTKDEIKKFLHPTAKITSLENALAHLLAQKSIFKIDEFYLTGDVPDLVERRREGNLRAELLLARG